MFGKKSGDLLPLVRAEVVGNDVNFLAARLIGHDVIEEGHERG